jgi:hypothetical protein
MLLCLVLLAAEEAMLPFRPFRSGDPSSLRRRFLLLKSDFIVRFAYLFGPE